ncbi:MAG: hypothetical protein QXK52_06460 [Candidatus Bathyarchaeia archaeon]
MGKFAEAMGARALLASKKGWKHALEGLHGGMRLGGNRPSRRSTSRGDSPKEADVEGRLRRELRRLQRLYGLGSGLEGVMWLPRGGGDLSGEVKGNTVYIYEQDPRRALETLRHEVLDHHLTKEVLDTLISLINLQKSAIERLVYRRKEEFLEKLSRTL